MEGLTKKEYNEWQVFLAANPPEEYDQSETFNDYFDRKIADLIVSGEIVGNPKDITNVNLSEAHNYVKAEQLKEAYVKSLDNYGNPLFEAMAKELSMSVAKR